MNLSYYYYLDRKESERREASLCHVIALRANNVELASLHIIRTQL